jgi:hypothetical protein
MDNYGRKFGHLFFILKNRNYLGEFGRPPRILDAAEQTEHGKKIRTTGPILKSQGPYVSHPLASPFSSYTARS